MNNDVLFRSLQQDPNAAALLKDRAALQTLLQSQETKQLLQLLSSQNGDALQQAAQSASKGDSSALSAMVEKLTATQEGARLLRQLQHQVQK